MRTIITFLLLLIIVAVIVLYFLPGSVHLEKSMVLKGVPQAVYDQINITQNWKKWAAWLQEDPANVITYNGPASGPGATLNWNSQIAEISSGNATLQSSQAPTQVKAEVDFNNYGKSENTYVLENTGNGTKVNWTLDLNVAEKGFPAGWINKVKALSWKRRIDAWMDASLKHLDEATADITTYPLPDAIDTLSQKVDSLAVKVDSLGRRIKPEADTLYIDTTFH